MKAPEIMTELVRTVRADEPVALALELLAATEARHLPVVSSRGELVGMLSDRDIRNVLGRYDADPQRFAEAWNTARMPVSDIMTRDPISIGVETDVQDIVALLVDEKIGALPVVDSDKRILGIITYIDVLRAWQREHEAISVPPILTTMTDLQDRALMGRGEQSGVPAAAAARRRRLEPAPPKARGSRGARITVAASRITPKKAAPKRAAPERAAPERVAPERTASKRAAPKRATPKRAVPERGAARR